MLTCANVHAMNCQDSTNENCGTYFSYFYFATFVFMCSYITTNLFLAFIMDNFVYLTHDMSTLDARQIHRFTAIWNTFDKKGIDRIRKQDLVLLLKTLDPPLGCGSLCPPRAIYSKLLKIKVPIEPDGQVKFIELLLSLVLSLLRIPTENNESMRDDMYALVPTIEDEVLDRVLPLSYDPRIFNEEEKDFYKECASYVIAGYFRLYKVSLFAAKKVITSHNSKQRPFKTRLATVDLTTLATQTVESQKSSSSKDRITTADDDTKEIAVV